MSNEHEELRLVSIFRELTSEDLAALHDLLQVRQFQAKDRIIEEGTPVSHFSIVLSGTIHVRRLAQKREMLMSRLGPGAFFGEINLFDPGVATASLYAMNTCTVAKVDYETVRQFMISHPAAGYQIVSGMMGELARRLRQTSTRLVQAAYWSSSQANK